MTSPVCADCIRDGVTSYRKPVVRNGKPVPANRCTTHERARKSRASDTAWERRLMATYGITADEYNAILAAQGGRCYICRRGNGRSKRLSVDHCHKTGRVRGLLDTGCNKWVLGMLRDDVDASRRVTEYLTSPPAFAVIGERVVPNHVPSLTTNEDKGAETNEC